MIRLPLNSRRVRFMLWLGFGVTRDDMTGEVVAFRWIR